MKAMNDVAREYGSALYMVACEDDDVKTYIDGLNVISDSFLKEPEYMLFLSSPNVPLNQRVSSLEAVFGDVMPQKLVSFLQLLCEKGRIEYFEDAKLTFLELYEDWK
ncbi:MAG: F0F1 ATP synthase subunit delta, partial [Clostridia bacterium]|nr:F0F1 ATP synthase subunit delta [Clostridia bacterium]